MNTVAFAIGSVEFYWSAIVIALGVLAWFMLSNSLFISHGGSRSAMWFVLALGSILSVLFSRFMHWYCHAEQYSGVLNELTDYSIGSYCLPGVLLGVLIAGIACKALGFTGNSGRLFDCLAPGAALGFALFKLSSLFNSSCRSKIAVNSAFLQRLPFASQISAGSSEYRFATFFVQFMLLLVLCFYLMQFFFKRRRFPTKANITKDGNVAFMFLIWYSALELIGDSTRYDSSFVRSNGFVSLVQIVSAVTILVILIIYSVRSIKANRLKWWHFVSWLGFLASVGIVGYTEYLVQRHGNWYMGCYPAMAFGCVMMALITYWLYLSVCKSPKRKAE